MTRAIALVRGRSTEVVRTDRTIRPVVRRITVTDDERTVTVNRPAGVAIARTQRTVSPVKPSRTITVNQGPAGPAGDEGSSTLGTFVLGENIASSSAVHVAADGLLYKADRSINRRADGFTIAGASLGGSLEIARSGVLNGLTGKTTGVRQWLSTNGLTTETIPTSGLLQEVGLAQSSDSVFFDPAEAVVLA